MLDRAHGTVALWRKAAQEYHMNNLLELAIRTERLSIFLIMILVLLLIAVIVPTVQDNRSQLKKHKRWSDDE